MKTIFWIKLLVFINFSALFAQLNPVHLEVGRKDMEYFSPKSYDGNSQNWAVVQDSNGFMYFGNTDGFILQYDGVTWRKIKVDNESIVRSLFITKDGTILVGAQNEFGYLKLDDSGELIYHSLIKQINALDIQFSDVWKIAVSQQTVYFISRNYLFYIPLNQVKNEHQKIKHIYSKERLHTFYNAGNDLFTLVIGKGLFSISNDSLQKLHGGEFYKNDLFSGILLSKKSTIIATRESGFFLYDDGESRPFKTDADEWAKKNQLYSTLVLNDENILLISRKGGALIINKNGKVLFKYDKSNGLKSNTIWAAYQDRAGSIWFCLNKGIVRLDYASPFSFYGEEFGLDGSIHDVKRFNGRLYVSTGTGLFYLQKKSSAFKNTRFIRFDEINTQCWYLTVTNDLLLACSNSGIYEINNRNEIRLVNKYSAWTIVQSVSNPNRFFIGLDSGIYSVLKQPDGLWHDEIVEQMTNIEGRTIAEDAQQNIWIGSSYQGIARITNFNKSLQSGEKLNIQYYTSENGLPSNRLNLVKQTQFGVRFNTTAGILKFDESSKRFTADPQFPVFNKMKQTEGSHVLSSEAENGNLWCNLGGKIVVISNKDKNQFIDKPFLNLPELNIQTIFVEQDSICWFGGAEGLIRFSGQLDNEAEIPLTCYIRSVFANNDSLVFAGGLHSEFTAPILNSNMNNLRFEFSLPVYNLSDKPLYQYRLEGYSEDWSAFKSETAKEYTNLAPGKYSFMVKTQTALGTGSTARFPFIILSPWYLSWWFITLLVFFLSWIVFLAARYLVKTTHNRAVFEQQKLSQERQAFEEDLRIQMAADFHDELGNKITRISLFSELIKQENAELPENVLKYVSKISENTNTLYTETRDFIWQLDPKKDTLFDFITRIKKFADELLDESTINFEMNNNVSNPDLVKLSMEWRRHLIRICKEALHNSFKYAQCKNISFNISFDDEELKIELSDDGVGFDVSKNSEGNGLRNMLNRSHKIGAKLTIDSKIGNGTKIKMTANKPA
ncbi:MAG: hypothetical protein D8M58_04740 [Calditrichaeota bacterium]|nr:MAG: hypothetical protein DWQ03_02335 [Calditrichota bacterium]MBL1204679.1 hypothetical protein [Calditrichota bacterium]NOG44507.1 hypothetical protein [Calditrichota bacterium]